MSNVVSLAAKREEMTPHWSGEVRCLHCKNEWVGVGPVGLIDGLECPECELPKGVVKNLFGPSVGDAVLQCSDCGAEIVTVYIRAKDGLKVARCVGCGLDLTETYFS